MQADPASSYSGTDYSNDCSSQRKKAPYWVRWARFLLERYKKKQLFPEWFSALKLPGASAFNRASFHTNGPVNVSVDAGDAFSDSVKRDVASLFTLPSLLPRPTHS